MPRRVPEHRIKDLFAAATAVFIEQGYRRTQMSDVARRLGVAKGTLYLYVESKEALFDAVLRNAAGEIPDPHLHFCFVGDGQRRGWIERAVARAGLAGRVHLTGLVPPQQIPVIMHASDIVVHCSLREGLARALPQAMLAAKPVVSFDVDGAAEVVDDQTGVLLRPGDADGLQLALGALAGNPQVRARLGAAGRDRARDSFDHRRMVDVIDDLYRRLGQG